MDVYISHSRVGYINVTMQYRAGDRMRFMLADELSFRGVSDEDAYTGTLEHIELPIYGGVNAPWLDAYGFDMATLRRVRGFTEIAEPGIGRALAHEAKRRRRLERLPF